MTKKFEGWIADLSDGTQRFESAPVPQEKSSWQKLLDELEEKGLEITRLTLVRKGHIVHSLPRKMLDGHIQIYEIHKLFWGGMGENADEQRLSQGIGSVVGEDVFLNLIDLTTGVIYQDVRPLKSCAVHSTMRNKKHDSRGSG